MANAGAVTIPPRTNVPPAIPKPPAASEPPPNHAKVAFCAAMPERVEIAVPVDAEANNPTLPYAPKPAKAPADAPVSKPVSICKELVTPNCISLISSEVNDWLKFVNLEDTTDNLYNNYLEYLSKKHPDLDINTISYSKKSGSFTKALNKYKKSI